MKFIKYIVGNPASGKSEIVKACKHQLFSDDNTVSYNVDNFKNYDLLEKGFTLDQVHTLSVIEGEKYIKPLVMQDKSIVAETTFVSFVKNIKNVIKLKNRGYFIEVYYTIPDHSDLIRNNNRKHPVPRNIFVESITDEFLQLMWKYADYYQPITPINSLHKDLFATKQFYKSFKSKHDIKTLSVKGDVCMDTNAIHFADSVDGALVYYDNVYEIKPKNIVYKYGNIFYSDEIEIDELVT